MVSRASPGGHPWPAGSKKNSSEKGDILSVLLKPCRIECREVLPCRLQAPWRLDFGETGPAFLIVLEGTATVEHAELARPLTIRKHDVVVLTREAGAVVSQRAGGGLVDRGRVLRLGDGMPGEHSLPGGSGPATSFICGEIGSDDEFLRQAFALLPPLLVAPGDGPDAIEYRPLLPPLLAEFEQHSPGSELLVNLILNALLLYAARATSVRFPEPDLLFPALSVSGMSDVLAAMQSHLARNWSVRELADLSGRSRSKFAAEFVDLFGRPPVEFLRELRLQKAARLLRESNAAIKEICREVGYNTTASFSRAFSESYGCPPAAYRRRPDPPRSASRDGAGPAPKPFDEKDGSVARSGENAD